jgi:hypothetical protein
VTIGHHFIVVVLADLCSIAGNYKLDCLHFKLCLCFSS